MQIINSLLRRRINALRFFTAVYLETVRYKTDDQNSTTN